MDLPHSVLYNLARLTDSSAKLSLRATCKTLQQIVDSREQLVLRISAATAPLPQLHALGLLPRVVTLDFSGLAADPHVTLPTSSLPTLKTLRLATCHRRMASAISATAPHLETVQLLPPQSISSQRDFELNVLSSFPNIRTLSLDPNSLQFVDQAAHLTRLTRLQDLTVNRSGWRDLPVEPWKAAIRYLTSLTRITLCCGMLPPIHPPPPSNELSSLTNLRSLTVQGNSSHFFPQLTSLSLLTHLYLSIPLNPASPLVTTDLRPFSTLTNLRHLTLTILDPTNFTLTPMSLECLTRCTALTHFVTDALYLCPSSDVYEALGEPSTMPIIPLPSLQVLSVGEMGFLRTTVPLSSAFPNLTQLIVSEFFEAGQDDMLVEGGLWGEPVMLQPPPPPGYWGGPLPPPPPAAGFWGAPVPLAHPLGAVAAEAAAAADGAVAAGEAADGAVAAGEAAGGAVAGEAAALGGPQGEQQQQQQQGEVHDLAHAAGGIPADLDLQQQQQLGAMPQGLENLQALAQQIQQEQQQQGEELPPNFINHIHHAPEYPLFDPTVDMLHGLTALQQLDIDMGNLLLYAQQPALGVLPQLRELRVEMVIDPRLKHAWEEQGGIPPLPHIKKLELYTNDAATKGWEEM